MPPQIRKSRPSAIDLSRPLAWKQPDATQQQMLQDLQAHVLKGHGRAYSTHLLLRFDQADAARQWLQRVAGQVTSAQQQLQASDDYQRSGRSGGLVTLVFLSHPGYQALQAAPQSTPRDPAFVQGMARRRSLLRDPVTRSWDAHWREPPHAMLLLADSSSSALQRARSKLLAGLPPAVSCVGEEAGRALASTLSPGEGIEHFGYVNGRSQPLMLREDILRERDQRDGSSVWDPAFGLDIALVPDPGGAGPHSHGSYLVFRKLEQNVRAFRQAETTLARTLGLKGEDAERAGAMMLGRFRDGTPLVLQKAAGANKPVLNNFDYLDDPDGAKCPFHSHVRRANPRGESGALGISIEHERAHLMPRRSIPYGQRSEAADAEGLRTSDLPVKGVGLLFMAYQSCIENQFEYLQALWAEGPVPAARGPGDDAAGGRRCPVSWSGRDAAGSHLQMRGKALDMRSFVTLKGGAYFFAPSISALKSI